MDCLKYYNGNLVGIASIFSAIKENNGTAIHALFTEKDIHDYMTYTSSECPMCKLGQKVDALVNSFGYSKI
jgi:orotate phosphoribosyltransferase